MSGPGPDAPVNLSLSKNCSKSLAAQSSKQNIGLMVNSVELKFGQGAVGMACLLHDV